MVPPIAILLQAGECAATAMKSILRLAVPVAELEELSDPVVAEFGGRFRIGAKIAA